MILGLDVMYIFGSEEKEKGGKLTLGLSMDFLVASMAPASPFPPPSPRSSTSSSPALHRVCNTPFAPISDHGAVLGFIVNDISSVNYLTYSYNLHHVHAAPFAPIYNRGSLLADDNRLLIVQDQVRLDSGVDIIVSARFSFTVAVWMPAWAIYRPMMPRRR